LTSQLSRYTTKELSAATWPDFERLFSQGSGWDHCWCMAFQRDRIPFGGADRTRAKVSVRNHEAKRRLVEDARAHGILVYSDDEPVGWCQYGPAEELSSVDRRKHSEPAADEAGPGQLWRITCFVTAKNHRRRGVADVALQAALDAIRGSGGGIVEAYPVAHWYVDRELGHLVRKYGAKSSEVQQHRARRRRPGGVFVQGVGPIEAAHGGFGNVSTQGTVSMFERAGFKAIAGRLVGCFVVRRPSKAGSLGVQYVGEPSTNAGLSCSSPGRPIT
jgi:GNAT superfamily N-acetyltransferase